MQEHRDADVNGVRLHYVTAGQGPLILFVHGFPEFWYAWRAQLAHFAASGHQAVAFDMRGHNLSSKPAAVADYAMHHLVSDIAALADHLGHRRFVLVGHDWGGAVAWAFAIRHPERLHRLVIVNAPHPAVFARELRDNPAQQKASQYMLAFRSAKAEELLSADHYAALVQGVLGEGLARGYVSEADRDEYLRAWSQPGALTGGLNYYRAARVGPPARDGAPASGTLGVEDGATQVSVPTLVIWGERDTALLIGNLDGLDRYVADLTVRRIPEGSHWVIHEQPDRINALIDEYLRGHDLAKA
jgi:pimeloyl-ACP methyl ester carboxylesterase